MLQRFSAGPVLIVAALSAAACSHAPPRTTAPPSSPPAAPRAQIGAWGLDLTARDGSVRPGDDFYRYADGHWLDTNHIPADRAQVLSNPHSPPRFRVNGVVRNVDAWYVAFDVHPEDKLYLPEQERVHIW